jgi:hypothetical protein
MEWNQDDDPEIMRNVTWMYDEDIEPPADMYKHEDDSLPHDELKLKEEFAHMFDKPLTSFLAMMPLDFWKNVLIHTNATAGVMVASHRKKLLAGRKWSGPFLLDELMNFVGLLVIMSLGKCGAYHSYWQGNSSMRVFMPRKYYLSLQILIHL